MKKRIVFLVIALVAVLAVLFACVPFIKVSLDKNIEVRGYKINVPEKWSSDSKGNLYDKKGNLAGSFTFVDVESENAPYLENVNSEISRDFLSDTVSKYEFSDDGKDVIIYYIKELPNPEPYAAELVFYNEFVSKRMAEKIYKTFQLPQIGKNPPPKNIPVPERDETVVHITDDEISNIGILSEFSEKLSAKESFSVNVLEYKKDGEETVLKSWYSLECAEGVGYMYTYYQKDDGAYTYDNNPVIFEELSKVISNEDEYTSYILKAAGKEDVQLFKIPLDRIRDNAKELVAMKTENADDEHVRKVMDKILSVDELKDLDVEVKEDSLSVQFGEGVKSDKGQAHSQAAVMFGIAENINSVTVKYSDGKEYTFTKDQINGITKSDVSTAATSEESFVKYTEEVKENQAQAVADGEVVYSGSVTISYNTMVTHPKTGERVEIGPYAEARGYGAYLGKPISCVIKRSGNGYIATASCGGSVIASYPLNSESEVNWAKGLIGAY